MVPAAVVTQSKLALITAVRLVSTAVSKIKVTRPRHVKPIITKTNSPTRRHTNRSPSIKVSNSPPRVTVVKALVVSAAQGLQGIWEWRPKCPILDHVSHNTSASMTLKRFDYNDALGRSKSGVIDSGCSRHMTGNMSYLSDFEELNGGYVSFGGNPNGDMISGKGKIRTDSLGKFDGKVDEGFLVRYFVSSKAFRVFNCRTHIVQETLHVNFLENKPNITGNQSNPSAGVQDKFDVEKAREESDQQYVLFPVWSTGSTNPHNTDEDATFAEKEPDFDEKKSESEVNVSLSSSAQSKKQDEKTKREAKGKSHVESFIRYIDLSVEFEDLFDNNINKVNVTADSPTHGKSSYIDDSHLPDDLDMPELKYNTYFDDEDDVGAKADFNNLETSITLIYRMEKELLEPNGFSEIKRMKEALWSGTRQDLSHKDIQEEGINYKEVFALVARIKAIRLFLAYASFMGFMVYQMDVKSAFLNGTIKEEVYVCQPLGFKDPDHPDKVYKVVKALYDLHQAPRAWYETLANYLFENDGKSASTPIDTEKPLLKDLDGKDVDVHIYRLMIGSLMYLTSSRPDIMFVVCACARFQVTPKASHLQSVKRIFRYLKGKPHLGLWYPKDSPFDLVAYSDSDYAGASLDRMSTTGGCQFLGCILTSWQYKKQTVMATSST
nr:uncharacterized mitochondrial protein AtMg00810-like [Tanacetum cinerariifolium]